MKKFSLIFILFNLTFINAFAQSEVDQARNYINDLGKKIIDIAGNKNISVMQKREALINLVDNVADTDWISKFVLGKYYRQANIQQKESFRKLYRQFMINTYSPKFTGYSGEDFSVEKIINEGNYYTAKCIFYPKDNAPEISLDFRIRKNTKSKEPEFLVFDIVAEGVSLIETQRSEFGSVIAKDGLEKFLSDFEKRVIRLKDENKEKPENS